MGATSERVLGKRTVLYMKNEALVGRITRQRLQNLASVLGVAGQVRLADLEEGDDRYRAMGEVLDAWASRGTLKGVNANQLSSALDQARLTYHAQAVRAMTEEAAASALPASAPTRANHHDNNLPPTSRKSLQTFSANGNNPPKTTMPARGSLSTPFHSSSTTNNDHNPRTTSSPRPTPSLTSTDRRSDGGTEEGSDSSLFGGGGGSSGKLPSVGELSDEKSSGFNAKKRRQKNKSMANGGATTVLPALVQQSPEKEEETNLLEYFPEYSNKKDESNALERRGMTSTLRNHEEEDFGDDSFKMLLDDDDEDDEPMGDYRSKFPDLTSQSKSKAAPTRRTLPSRIPAKAKKPTESKSIKESTLLFDNKATDANEGLPGVASPKRSKRRGIPKPKSLVKPSAENKDLPDEWGMFDAESLFPSAESSSKKQIQSPKRGLQSRKTLVKPQQDIPTPDWDLFEKEEQQKSPKKQQNGTKMSPTRIPSKMRSVPGTKSMGNIADESDMLKDQAQFGGSHNFNKPNNSPKRQVTKSPKKNLSRDKKLDSRLNKTPSDFSDSDDFLPPTLNKQSSPKKTSPRRRTLNTFKLNEKTKNQIDQDDDFDKNFPDSPQKSKKQRQPISRRTKSMSPTKKQKSFDDDDDDDFDFGRRTTKARDSSKSPTKNIPSPTRRITRPSRPREDSVTSSPEKIKISKTKSTMDLLLQQQKLEEKSNELQSRPTRGRSRSQPVKDQEHRDSISRSPKKANSKAESKIMKAEESNKGSARSSNRSLESAKERRLRYYSKYGTWREMQKISKEKMKKPPAEEDTLPQDIEKVLSGIDYLDANEKKAYSGALLTKLRAEKYLGSLCAFNKDYLHCAVHVYSSFGTDLTPVASRTQTMVWFTLERLRRFWIAAEEPIPAPEDIVKHRETMELLRGVAKLCFHVTSSEQSAITGIMENDKKRRKRIYITFKSFGVRIAKRELTLLGISRMKETGNFIEVHFVNSLFVDFLAALHAHIGDEDVKELGKPKLITCLPFLCGLASRDRTSASQKVVARLIFGLVGLSATRDPDYYIRFLQNMWLESQQTFLNCVFESRMKNVAVYPPPGDRNIVLALSTVRLHDVIPLAYYLDNVDKTKVSLEGLMMQEVNMDDNCLRTIGKNVWSVKKVTITGNFFTVKGVTDAVKHIKGNSGDTLRIRSLDFSDSNIDDDSLAKLNPVLPFLEELCLSDNFFTWYGIRKIAMKKMKRLKRLELCRCGLNEHAFYELMPLLVRTEHVNLEGNDMSALELKIFARHVRESQVFRLDTLILNNCKLDDECLVELGKFVTKISHIHLQNNAFTSQGIRAMARYCRKNEMGVMKSLNLRGCKMTTDCLEEMFDLVPRLESVTLSNNNFSDPVGLIMLCQHLTSEAAEGRKVVTFIDLRHCRLVEASKKMLVEAGRKNKIDIKMW